MSRLQIETRNKTSAFEPGAAVEVNLSWDLPEPPSSIELRLVWNTEGKGDRDLKMAKKIQINEPAAADSQKVEMILPWGPYSFSGKLISLVWALELVVQPSLKSVRKIITIAPAGQEVQILGGDL